MVSKSLAKTKIEVDFSIDDDLQAAIRRANGAGNYIGLDKAIKAAAKHVKDRTVALCPRGDPADKPGQKPLFKTIAVAIRTYDSGNMVAVIGPQYPAGAHGHLVEFGHDIVKHDGTSTGKRATPKPFMRPAADGTKAAQVVAFNAALRKEIAKIKSKY